jgi:putative DNA primase/helicase
MTSPDFYDVECSFLEAMNDAGIAPSNEGIHADGQIHRYHIDGDSHGSKNGSYQLWVEGLNHDGRPNGWFMDYKRGGEKEKWQYFNRDNLPPREKPTDAERGAARARREEDERAEAVRRAKASERAREIWHSAKAVESGGHPYLVQKRVEPYGDMRVSDDGARLILPWRDIWTGDIVTVQYIAGDGKKRWHSGAPKRGG